MAEVKAADTGVAANWSKETKVAILNHIDAAAQVIGCSATANAKGAIEVKDSAGTVIAINDKLVKTTVFSVESMIAVGFCILTALCARAFVSKKAELF